jgi:hypothetical protein
MDKFRLVPQSAGYAIAPPVGEVIASEVPGGLPMLSADIEGGVSIVDVSFMLDAGDWQYTEAFMRNRTGAGAEPFLIDMILNGSDIAEFTVMLVPESKHLTAAVAQIRYLSLQLYALPAEVDEDADSSIVDIYEASDGDMTGYLNGFAAIIAALPDA